MKIKPRWEEKVYPEPGSDTPVDRGQGKSTLRERRGRDNNCMQRNDCSSSSWISVVSGRWSTDAQPKEPAPLQQTSVTAIIYAVYLLLRATAHPSYATILVQLLVFSTLSPVYPPPGSARLRRWTPRNCIAWIPGRLASAWAWQEMEGKRRERMGYLSPALSLLYRG